MERHSIQYQQGQRDYNNGLLGTIDRPTITEEYWWGVDDASIAASRTCRQDLLSEKTTCKNSSGHLAKGTSVGVRIGNIMKRIAKARNENPAVTFAAAGGEQSIRNIINTRTGKPQLETVAAIAKIAEFSFQELTGYSRSGYRKLNPNGTRYDA